MCMCVCLFVHGFVTIVAFASFPFTLFCFFFSCFFYSIPLDKSKRKPRKKVLYIYNRRMKNAHKFVFIRSGWAAGPNDHFSPIVIGGMFSTIFNTGL